MSIDWYQRITVDLVRDDAGRITSEQVDEAIAAAVAQYSAEAPRTLTVEMTGQSGQLLTAPAGWSAGESRLVSIEYPVGEVPPEYIADGAAWVLPQPDGTEKIGLADSLPAASTLWVRFTAPHEVDGQTDTVADGKRLGIAMLAGARLCGQLASWYANQTDSTIAVDAVEHKSKSELWAARERQLLAQAEVILGIGLRAAQNATPPAGGTVVSFEPRRGNKWQRGLRLV